MHQVSLMPRHATLVPGRSVSTCLLLTALMGTFGGCSEGQDAPRFVLPLYALPMEGNGSVTNTGWATTIVQFETRLEGVELTEPAAEVRISASLRPPQSGTVRARKRGSRHPRADSTPGPLARLRPLLWGQAWAHPGHEAGDEVIGYWEGQANVSWTPSVPTPIGDASALEGPYGAVSLVYRTPKPAADAPDAGASTSMLAAPTGRRCRRLPSFGCTRPIPGDAGRCGCPHRALGWPVGCHRHRLSIGRPHHRTPFVR